MNVNPIENYFYGKYSMVPIQFGIRNEKKPTDMARVTKKK
jgi:hypothetical protein